MKQSSAISLKSNQQFGHVQNYKLHSKWYNMYLSVAWSSQNILIKEEDKLFKIEITH